MRKAELLASIIAVVSLLAQGCVTSPTPPPPPLSDGQRLQLNRGFDNLANGARIYLQNGSIVEESKLDRWSTHCSLRVYNPARGSDYLTSIAAGDFSISNVKLWYESSEFPYYGIQTRTTGIGFGLIGYRKDIGPLSRQNGPPGSYHYRVEMRINSSSQPDLRNMICAHKSVSRGYHYPTRVQIESALGDIVVISP